MVAQETFNLHSRGSNPCRSTKKLLGETNYIKNCFAKCTDVSYYQEYFAQHQNRVCLCSPTTKTQKVVLGILPTGKQKSHRIVAPSSSGLGRCPFKAKTGVQFSLELPKIECIEYQYSLCIGKNTPIHEGIVVIVASGVRVLNIPRNCGSVGKLASPQNLKFCVLWVRLPSLLPTF